MNASARPFCLWHAAVRNSALAREAPGAFGVEQMHMRARRRQTQRFADVVARRAVDAGNDHGALRVMRRVGKAPMQQQIGAKVLDQLDGERK